VYHKLYIITSSMYTLAILTSNKRRLEEVSNDYLLQFTIIDIATVGQYIFGIPTLQYYIIDSCYD